MYNNIGSKIKSLAAGTFLVESICSIIIGIFLAFEEDILYIFIAVGVPIIAWISSWILYAFGELVEDVSHIRKHFVPDETIAQTNNQNKVINPPKPACDFFGKQKYKLKTYKSNSTLGSGEAEFNLCENCAKKNGFI